MPINTLKELSVITAFKCGFFGNRQQKPFPNTNPLLSMELQEYAATIRDLPEKLQELIFKNYITVQTALDIQELWALPLEERQNRLFTAEQLAAIPPLWWFNYNLTKSQYEAYDRMLADMILVLYHISKSNIVPVEYLEKIPTNLQVPYLVTDIAVQAFMEELITPEQVANMPTIHHVLHLLTDIGMQALREKLITPEEVAAMPSVDHLKRLLTKDGLQALREHDFTLKWALQEQNIRHALDFSALWNKWKQDPNHQKKRIQSNWRNRLRRRRGNRAVTSLSAPKATNQKSGLNQILLLNR